MVTWLFEQDTFVPAAKLVANGECFSIISDYLGTPLQAYDKKGNKVWEQELDIYGRQRKRPSAFIPFKYQGQYEDIETGLYYNRFRYYDPNAGSYISQDPIGLAGGDNLYAYVPNPSSYIDIFGLSGQRWMTKTKKDGTPYKKPGPRQREQEHTMRKQKKLLSEKVPSQVSLILEVEWKKRKILLTHQMEVSPIEEWTRHLKEQMAAFII